MPSVFPTKMFTKSEHSELDNYKLQVEILQQKLAKSEEYRQQLEEKFDKIQKKRTEYEKSYKTRSRVKFEEFLEKQRERNERNKKIIRMLEHIDQQAVLLSQRSNRLKAMKRQYELYFARLLQTQAFRIQNSPQYSYLPLNHYSTIMQPCDLIPMIESKNKISEPQVNPELITTNNMYPTIQDLTKHNIPSIVKMPPTPTSDISPRFAGLVQAMPTQSMGNWNYTTTNNSYPIANIPNTPQMLAQHPGLTGGVIESGAPSFRYNLNYGSQPNPFDYYNSPAILGQQHSLQVPVSGLARSQQEQWGSPNRYLESGPSSNSRNPNFYNNAPTQDLSMKIDPDDMYNPTVQSQKLNSPYQRTFKDFDRSEPNKFINKKLLNESGSFSHDYDFTKANEDDLNLLRGLNSRNRGKTVEEPNENDLIKEHNRISNSNRQRSPSRYTVSNSPSIEEKNLKYSHLGENNPEKSISDTLSGIEISDNDNNYNDRREELRRNSIISQPSTISRSSPAIDGNQYQTGVMKQPLVNDESTLPSGIKNYNPREGSEPYVPSINNISKPNNALNEIGLSTDDRANNDKIIIPSKTSFSSNNTQSSISTPQYYNPDNAGLLSIDKKSRPALLKKIELPSYLSPKIKSGIASNNVERTNILNVHQPFGTQDSLPMQFAKKEKLTLDNIENTIYGELINPDIPITSVDEDETVNQILRQHQTPAQIIAQTNQGRIPNVDTYKPKPVSLKEPSKTIDDNQTDKDDLSEKMVKPKIEILNTKPLNMPLSKIKVDEPVTETQFKDPSNVQIESPKISKPPELEKEFDTSHSNIPQEVVSNQYENIQNEQQPEPIYNNQLPQPDNNIPDLQQSFDYNNSSQEILENYDQPADEIVNNVAAAEEYQKEIDPAANNIYQTDQQQYDNSQNYEQYNQEYSHDNQNEYQNYPTDNTYQGEYDPNTYNYNYDQQQPNDDTYAPYDPNQQYSDQDYSQQAYEDQNYSNQQYTEPEYSNEQITSNPEELNQYDYTQQNMEPEGYDQPQLTQDQLLTNQNEPITEQQIELDEIPGVNPPVTENILPTQSKSVRPILTKEKSVDSENKKKKRVNFVDSSDESSSRGQQQLPTDESDFDFSSQ